MIKKHNSEKKAGQIIKAPVIDKKKLKKNTTNARCIPDQDHVPPMPMHFDTQPVFLEMPIEDHVPTMPVRSTTPEDENKK